MILLFALYSNKTSLYKISSISFFKRFYPGFGDVGHAKGILKIFSRPPVFFRPNQIAALLPFRPNTTALVPYKHVCRELIPYNPRKLFEANRINATAINVFVEEGMNNIVMMKGVKDDIAFIKETISTKGIISEDKIKKFLSYFKEKYIIEEHRENLLQIMREYFVNHPPTIEIALLFLDIWNNGNFIFKPLKDVVINNNNNNIISTENKSITANSSDNRSYEDKKKEDLQKVSEITKKINHLFLKYNDKEVLYSQEINAWYDYLETRGNVIPLQPAEIEIHNKLKALREKYFPKKEDLLADEKDNLYFLKKDSKLPLHLQNKISEDCFVLEDIELEIKKIEDLLTYLNNDLSVNDLKLISLLAGSLIIDEEGTLKIPQHLYKKFSEIKEKINIESSNILPDAKTIISDIEQKKGIVLTTVPQTPDSIVSVAHLSHKTYVVKVYEHDKNMYVRCGIITSTKDGSTIKLDKYQITNPDITKQDKNQMFRILSNFIIVDENEPLTVDLEMTLFMRGKNTAGEDIIQILVREFNSRKNIWSNNPYQFSYTANEDFMRNITTIILKEKREHFTEKLQDLENKLNSFLKKNDTKAYEKELLKGLEAKEKDKQYRDNQRYFSLLPEHLQKLAKSIDIVEEKIKKNLEQEKKKAYKKEVEMILAQHKENQIKAQSENTITSASQRKKDYIKKKQEENENNIRKDN